MKYFGTKQTAEVDENAVAAERLMAIASRFKSERPGEISGESNAAGKDEPPADVSN